MEYKFLNYNFDAEDISLKESEKINSCLLKNNKPDIIKALNYLASDKKFLYVHGFLGTGKRQFVNYICEYLTKDVIRLEYYCKESTVCDDILLMFTENLEKRAISKSVNLNAKITTLAAKFQKMVSSIKKPFLIILHSLDNIAEDNLQYITKVFSDVIRSDNVKIIITTRALKQNLLGNVDEDCRVFLKAFTKEIFKEFLAINKVEASERQIEDFYALTRGYYFYTALAIKIIQSLHVKLPEFMQKVNAAEVSFDTFIGETYISMIPSAIRNFFWFLRTVRHGLSLNALAIFEIYDEFSIDYLKSNLIIFQDNEMLYLHDYFAQKVAIMLPPNVEIKLHKYIIKIYEGQLRESVATRAILISRQALRTEIEYHSNRIKDIESGNQTQLNNIDNPNTEIKSIQTNETTKAQNNTAIPISSKINEAKKLVTENKITEAIEAYSQILQTDGIDLISLVDTRLNLARLYCKSGNFSGAIHYFELVETYYKQKNEFINLNYLYYEMTNLYYKMYKHERAIETIKKVIYSVDTPQSLMVSACTLLGNIYSDMNNPEDAFSYYKKAIESLDENVEDSVLSELYFKYALANDENGNIENALEYYNECICIQNDNKYTALAYSNMASCYYENGNDDEALNCFKKAYDIEKTNNNYDGIYYTASKIAKILKRISPDESLKYLIEAKRSADFIDESFYMADASVALGDYYYNIADKKKEAVTEYFRAKNIAMNSSENIDISSIERRISDMQLRMPKEDFEEIQKKYDR